MYCGEATHSLCKLCGLYCGKTTHSLYKLYALYRVEANHSLYKLYVLYCVEAKHSLCKLCIVLCWSNPLIVQTVRIALRSEKATYRTNCLHSIVLKQLVHCINSLLCTARRKTNHGINCGPMYRTDLRKPIVHCVWTVWIALYLLSRVVNYVVWYSLVPHCMHGTQSL